MLWVYEPDDEEEVIRSWAEEGKVFSIYDDQAREAEVDGGGEEDRGDCHADEIAGMTRKSGLFGSRFVVRLSHQNMGHSQQEWILQKGIVMHLHSADIAQNLKHTSEGHGDKEAPGTVPNPEDKIEKEAETKDGEVQDIAGEIGHIW